MVLMIVLSWFPLFVLDMDVNVLHDHSVMVSYMCSKYGCLLMFLMIVLSCVSLCFLDIDVSVHHDRAVMFSSVFSRYLRYYSS